MDLCYNKNYENKEGEEAKDFITLILNVDPKERLSLQQMAEHPFLNRIWKIKSQNYYYFQIYWF